MKMLRNGWRFKLIILDILWHSKRVRAKTVNKAYFCGDIPIIFEAPVTSLRIQIHFLDNIFMRF